MTEADAFAGCAIVMAHPDDEVLWASSILARAGQVVLCYGDLPSSPAISAGRRAAMAAFPLPTLRWLALTEAESFRAAAWPEPAETAEGLALRPRPGASPGLSPARYAANFGALGERLRETLAGVKVVVTHNPWGEYGHEDHVQVFKAVDGLREALGFELWVSGYVGDEAAPFARRFLPRLGAASAALPTDAALAARLRALYEANQCWTWPADYVWPARECFFRWSGGGVAPRPATVLPLNYLVWPPRPRPGSATRLRRKAARLIRRLAGRG